MEDTANSRTLAVDVAEFLDSHKGGDTVALFIGAISSFTDCFVITTATSEAHMRGLRKNLLDMLGERKIDLPHRKRSAVGDGWMLLDCGNLVIHVMTQEKRAFYDLERLWFEGEILYQSSSKSS